MTRPRTLALLLGLVVAGSAVLAYQGWDATRSHRRSAEGTLQSYARLAAWQFAQASNTRMQSVLFSAFGSTVDALRYGPLSTSQLRRNITLAHRDCQCVHELRWVFRAELRDRSTDAPLQALGDTPMPTALQRYLMDSLAVLAKAARTRSPSSTNLPMPDVEVSVYAGGPAADDTLSRTMIDFTHLMLFAPTQAADEIAPSRRSRPTDHGVAAVGLLLATTPSGEPLAAYGFVVDAAPLAQRVFGRVFASERLLPPTLVRDDPGPVLVHARVRAAGVEIYRSLADVVVEEDAGYVAAVDLPVRGGGASVDVTLSQRAAEQLLVGGLPTTRVPAIGLLLLSTMGLAVAIALLMRRQQELVRLRSEFVASVSHELRTPLAQIRLLAELLAHDKIGPEPTRRRSVRIIDQEARRLTFLVENILTFSRAERRGTRVAQTAVDLSVELGETVAAFEPLAHAHEVTLALTVPASCPAWADRDAVRQIMLNLLDNAVRYGPPRTTVSISAVAGHTVARITVDDEGPGIPEAERARIWEPYYRLARDEQRSSTGSGIGLAIVHDLVEQHGGRAAVEGRPGGGARFVVELPTRRHSLRASATVTGSAGTPPRSYP